MAVDRGVVDYVAELAKLRLEEGEKDALAEQLGRILDYVEQLAAVDISDVPPTKHVLGATNIDRPDTPHECLSQERALANAPQADEGHFVVPKVLPD